MYEPIICKTKLSSVIQFLILSTKIPVTIKTLILTGISVFSFKSFETLKWMKTFKLLFLS